MEPACTFCSEGLSSEQGRAADGAGMSKRSLRAVTGELPLCQQGHQGQTEREMTRASESRVKHLVKAAFPF